MYGLLSWVTVPTNMYRLFSIHFPLLGTLLDLQIRFVQEQPKNPPRHRKVCFMPLKNMQSPGQHRDVGFLVGWLVEQERIFN